MFIRCVHVTFLRRENYCFSQSDTFKMHVNTDNEANYNKQIHYSFPKTYSSRLIFEYQQQLISPVITIESTRRFK